MFLRLLTAILLGLILLAWTTAADIADDDRLLAGEFFLQKNNLR